MKSAESERASDRPGSGRREPYVPPRIERIQLSVDEALMSVCKSGLTDGPSGPMCMGRFDGFCMGGGS